VLAAREGRAELTVERLLACSGASRATFYQYFSSVQDAFCTAYRQHAEVVLAAIDIATRRAEHPQLAMVQVLIELKRERPDVAQLLLGECMAAGPVGLFERDAFIAGIEGAIEGTAKGQAIDLPAKVLIGGMFRFLSMNVAGADARESREEALRWALAFQRPVSQAYWSASFVPEPCEEPPPARGLTSSREKVAPRERIIRATAGSIRRGGYGATSVADIVAAARVSRRSFYNEFPNKAAAFIAAYEFGFQQTLAGVAPAFFSAERWPERVWQSALAFTSYFSREPSFAYLGFVECHALGRQFASRVQETQLAFTLFLEDGYRQSEGSENPRRASSALTAAAIAETGFLASRGSTSLYIRRMQPLAVYIALTPFIGSEQAGQFVAEKLATT